jgi:N-acetyl-anhydromuramyl-L-alanine amidase AmpD|tara:strand:- start:2257 stop:2991 length:735 start_codon:yes stop_codon:yes gene_type:complete
MPNPVIAPGGAPDLAGFREAYPAARTFYAPAHPSNYRSPRTDPHPWRGIVWHTAEEDAHDGIFVAPWWFQQIHPGQEGSTYLALEGDGDLYQCVQFDDYAFAQGATLRNASGPDLLILSEGITNYNNGLMSVELEGRAATINETFTRGAAQWRTAVRFAAWFCLEHDIPIDRDHMLGHHEIPNQSHWDPNFAPPVWDALLEDIHLEAAKLRSVNAAPSVEVGTHTHVLRRAPLFKTGPPLFEAT